MNQTDEILRKLQRLESLLIERRSPWMDFNSARDYLAIGRTKLKELINELRIPVYYLGKNGRGRILKLDLNRVLLFGKKKVRLSSLEKEYLKDISR